MEAHRERLAHQPGPRVGDDVAGVGVDADQAGDLRGDAGFLGGLPDRRIGPLSPGSTWPPGNVWIVLAVAMTAWMLGSVAGYEIGVRGGRRVLDHPGRLEKSRRKLPAKGDRAFARWNFLASVTMPAFVSGIFRVRFPIFILGAAVAGIG